MSLAENYVNRLYVHVDHPGGVPCKRWWFDPRVLCGGSILDAADYSHLVRDFGVTHVLNLETEHSDLGKGIAQLLEIPTPDDGQGKPRKWFASGIAFTRTAFTRTATKLYVHCQMGGSRTPLMAYAIGRTVLGLDPGSALARIRQDISGYGDHPNHQRYLASANAVIGAGL